MPSSSAIADFILFILTLFINLPVPGLSCGMLAFSYGIWDLVPWPGIEPGPPALGAQSLDHWTTRLSPPSVQFRLVIQSCPTLFDPMDSSTPGLPVHHKLPELAHTHVHRVDDAIQPSHPLSSPLLLPSIFPSIRVFSNESVFPIRWPNSWSFSFSISPSNEYSGLISLRMDWLDLLEVRRTLKNLFQHHSSKASIFQHSAFFTVQLSHPYMTTGKTIALIRWTFVGKVMSLLFNMLSWS